MRPHIERWLGVERGARAERWLAHQAEYDLRQAEHSRKRKLAKVKHIGPQPAQW
jgi:plasmid maintenance system antidote protein VapI